MSIPKKIHYCWFGRGEKSELIKKCMDSWKKYCPDWEIIEWNEDTGSWLSLMEKIFNRLPLIPGIYFGLKRKLKTLRNKR